MRKQLLGIAAALMLTASVAANAVPVGYNVNFAANVGASGVGSFTFDNSIGAITDFFWDFGGIIGGPDDAYGSGVVFGDTVGRFVFEMLSQTDVHSGSNCVGVVGCSATGPFTGSGPGGAFLFRIETALTSVNYAFRDASGTNLASGVISIAHVPEPSTLSLVFVALLGLGFVLRSRRT